MPPRVKTADINQQRGARTNAPMPLMAKQCSVSYDPTLIDQLRDDHQWLLRVFTQVNFLASDNQFKDASIALRAFRSTLVNHLHLENLKLYIYLQYSLIDNEPEFAQLRAFRKEMNGISKTALDFFDKYEKEGISSENKSEFLSDLGMLGHILSKRTQQEEEQLYTMYHDLG